MKIPLLLLITFPSICFSLDETSTKFSGQDLCFSYPAPYSVSGKPRKTSGECYELSTNRDRDKTLISEVCKFSNANLELMDSYGFQEYKNMPDFSEEHEGYQGKFIYASALSTYPVKELRTDYGVVFTAEEVDCDVQNDQPIYRPTGICDVAFVRLKKGGGLYVNFVIKNNVKRLDIATHEDFRALLKSIRRGKQCLQAAQPVQE